MEITRKAVSGMMLTLLFIGILTMAFTIQSTEADQEPQLSLDTDKNIYILGENITITLTNIGSETVNIGGYPAWTIFTYPKEEPVYPSIFAFLAWSLDPGENDTFIWNQCDETGSLMEPGMYVVRDIHGWGLSACFKIEKHWVPYVPNPEIVDLAFWTANQKAYVNVTITFGDPCINILDWGTVTKAGHDIWVNSEIWDWTGCCIQIIWSVSHTYELGYLENGNYTFTFKAWDNDVKSINFTVTEVIPEFPPLLLETDKDVYVLGELVTFTLTNIGNETVHFGGWPFLEVYIWPLRIHVAPATFAFLAWKLDPGQSNSWTWNQINEYTRNPVEAGLYVAKDIYGYNYTTFFRIIDATDPVPEFSPAIILPLFMILSIITVIFAKRRLPTKPKNLLSKTSISIIYPFLSLNTAFRESF